MARMSEKRKAELQRSYGNDTLTPIHPKYIEQARELSARYILFVNKDNRHGYCEKCCHDIKFEKTKHKDKVVCPNCGTELTIQHTWRKPSCDYEVDWYVIGEALDNETFALRYIRSSRNADYTTTVLESAREIYDFKHGWSYRFSNLTWENGWTVNNNYFFTEFAAMWHRRKECCIGAKTINNVPAELKKLDAMKYFDQLLSYYSVYTYARDNVKQLMNTSLYEKLEKVGLSNIAKTDYKNYWVRIKYKRSETSLVKMLGINKLQYNLLLKYRTNEALSFIRSNKEMSIQFADYLIGNDAIRTYNSVKDNSDVPENRKQKVVKYLVNNKVNTWEYNHYLYMMKELEYKIDDSYLMPKDFRKADDRVTDEWNAKQDEKMLAGMSEQSKLIKEISDGLKKMSDLAEFLEGAKGLLVYVPESAKDLVTEARLLHNCIGTYVDRIAEGKTLVFFVRKLDTPDAPFVAFEYCNGEVVQCRYDHNKNVEDAKIINFVDAFAERLRKNNVLYKAA